MSDKIGKGKYSFEEFKLYYESAEKVTDRRLETNRWNYSLCVALLVAIAAIIKWSFSTADFLWIGFAAVVFLSLTAILYCALWIGQIRSFKQLNNAKFSVLNEMSKKIEFDANNPGILVSYCPFEKEWKKLDEIHALEEIRKSNIVALKSSNIEYFVPRAIAALFGAILAVLTLVIILKWPIASRLRTDTSGLGTPTTQGSKP